MEKIKKLIKWKLELLKKIDKTIGEWVLKVPMFLFDFIIVTIMCLSFIWGIIAIIIHSLDFGLFIILVSYAIAIYLIIKRHKKLQEIINKM
jgi:uncharacterized membrane protein YoaK (UPF0700 family)